MTAAADPASIAGFVIDPLPEAELDRIRAAGLDDFGNPLVAVTVEGPGAPLRCCLRDASAGEVVGLIAYRAGGKGPYAEVGPIFIHAQKCSGYATRNRYPEGFRHRQQVFRAYNAAGTIADALVVEGADAETAITSLLGRAEIVSVQSRNVNYGCYMFAISRA